MSYPRSIPFRRPIGILLLVIVSIAVVATHVSANTASVPAVVGGQTTVSITGTMVASAIGCANAGLGPTLVVAPGSSGYTSPVMLLGKGGGSLLAAASTGSGNDCIYLGSSTLGLGLVQLVDCGAGSNELWAPSSLLGLLGLVTINANCKPFRTAT